MARAVAELEAQIRSLSGHEKADLIKSLLSELDAPADPSVDLAWLKESQRRLNQLRQGTVKGVPGELVFEHLRTRLGQ
jgi:putative addiction module component (TIGR02574 family)